MRKTDALLIKLKSNDYIDVIVARNLKTFYITLDCGDYVAPKVLKFIDKKIGQNLKEQFILVNKIKKEEKRIAMILNKEKISYCWKLFHKKLWKIIKDSDEYKRRPKLKKKIKVKKTKKKLVIKSRKKDSNTKTAVQ